MIKSAQQIDGIINDQEYTQKKVFQNGDFELNWRIDNEIITFAMKAKTNGWISIGIDPEFKMLNADIYIGWVNKDSSTVLYDCFCSVEMGPHPPDTEQGGSNDILTFAGKENGNFTVIEFSRKLDTQDIKDKVIPKTGKVKVMVAYGATDEFSPHHIFRTTDDIEMQSTKTSFIEINVQQAKELIDKANNLQILDASPNWNQGHIPGSINIESNVLQQNLEKLDTKKAILVYSHEDISSVNAANILSSNGFKTVFRLFGNFKAWVDAGYPIEKSAEKIIIRFKINSLTYFVGSVSKTMDSPPIVKDGRTLLPIRYLAEAIGAVVYWDSKTQRITITLNQITIILTIGQSVAIINGQSIKIDPDNPQVKPIVVPPGRTLLPLRFVAERLNCVVSWNQTKQEITITYPK
jgi:rhodanese-related sulfurtransferase